MVEALPEEELRLLDVGRLVSSFTLYDTLELHRRLGVMLLLVKTQGIGQRLAGGPGWRRRRCRDLSHIGGGEHHLLRVRRRPDAQRGR